MKSAKIHMRGPTYRYDTVTCRYERIPLSKGKIFSYAIMLMLCSSAMLAGLLFVHDHLFETPGEIALRKENTALEKYQTIFTKQLEEIDTRLIMLQEKDKGLHTKFFSALSTSTSSKPLSESKNNILLANASDFTKIVNEVKDASHFLITNSRNANLQVAEQIDLSAKDVEKLSSIPLAHPIRNLMPEKVLSGFGMRINPFHKGLYEHTGIDIAMPRGTDVLATAPGKVITAKKSDLQAGYGNYVEIDHGNGFVTRYAHLQDLFVRVGHHIEKGIVIATTGSSGGSVAPHLHYEIIRYGLNVDPVLYMITGVSTDLHEQFITIGQKENQSLD